MAADEDEADTQPRLPTIVRAALPSALASSGPNVMVFGQVAFTIQLSPGISKLADLLQASSHDA